MDWQTLLCDDRIRSYKKQSSTDLRTESKRDYHRTISSASFRRPQDKTQVFPLDRSGFIRTRLTRSLEVSSLAKSLGQNISKSIHTIIKDKTFTPEHKAAVCDILQRAGLIHDIGSSPLGHFGETAIQDWFKKNLERLTLRERTLAEILEPQMVQDFCRFEGNTQAFRMVTRLHFLVNEHDVNLTKALLGTIIKYPVSSLEIDKDSDDIRTKKIGYPHGDRENFQDAQVSTGILGKRHSLAFILEAADDIAYKTANIEDAVKEGCVSYEHPLAELKTYKAGSQTNHYIQIVSWLEEKYGKAMGKGYDRPDLYTVRNWIISVQGRMISGVTECFAGNYESIMEGTYTNDLFAGTDVELLMEVLGDIALRYTFSTRSVLKLEIAVQTILDFLLDRFVDAVVLHDMDLPITQVQKELVSLISGNYKMIYSTYAQDRNDAGRLYLRLPLVTDYICSTTDTFARDMHQELSGIRQTAERRPDG